ncbi:inositol monophosphatase family protein [Leifsonia flava]|uniref:Inositol-1-monophosphatase n=1 Tax=Orlajensenia leifsoniae TaxID=2561933 RepID=A0A4Y9R1Y0_9MICO|nr:inositol monophosphatase family protein [Leifsonia flava]TFV98012.1 inositol monophosphatase [Leifsonia flava]
MTAAANSDLLTLAHDIATQAGALALQRRREGVDVAATKSGPTDIVTQADRETEALIRSLIADARPNDGFFGEESDASGGSSGLTWVVDPIDGTVNFLYGLPAWAVSVAVVEGDPDPATWNALAGVVVGPAAGETYRASAGGGAWLGDTRLAVNQGVELPYALVATGFSYSSETRAAQAEILRTILPRVRDIRRIGSAALDLSYLAAGRLDVHFERGLNPWDHAAGGLIAREAGAKVGGVGGAAESTAMTIAAEPALFDAFEGLLIEAGYTA